MIKLDFRKTAVIAACLATAIGFGSGQRALAKANAAPSLSARLVDPEAKAQKKEATVEVKVKGVAMVDPAATKEKPKAGQGHLHYQLDNGPVIATTATKLSFHELASGAHSLKVVLAANDHKPLGPEQQLNVTVP